MIVETMSENKSGNGSGSEEMYEIADSSPLEEFMIAAGRQDETQEFLRKIKSSLSKTSKDRRTADWHSKISERVNALWNEFVACDAQLKGNENYAGSEYKMKGVYKVVEEIYVSILDWLTKERAKVATVEKLIPRCSLKMRQFYFEMVTGYLGDYEGQTEEELCGIDFSFVIDRIEKAFANFVEQNDKVLADPYYSHTSHNLESQQLELSTRVQAYFRSIRPPMVPSSVVEQAGTSKSSLKLPSTPITLESVVAALTAKHHTSDARLPRLELPKFDGKLDQWRDFKDTFTAIVHDNPRLKPIDKMTYLKGCLSGEAHGVVKNMALSQYEEGWEAVVSRYQNVKVLIYNGLRKLLSLPQATERARDIKLLIDDVKVIRVDLAELGEPVAQWNSLFVFLMTQKLPKDTFEAFEQSCESKKKVPLLASLLEFLENRVHTLLAVEKSFDKPTRIQANVVALKPEYSLPKPTNNARIPQPNNPPTSKPITGSKCKFCMGNHRQYKCPKFAQSNVMERKKLVAENKLCVLCLNDHPVATCAHKWKCLVCQEKHHTLLHVDLSSSSFCGSGENVLLATARIKVRSEEGIARTIRVLIDQGSMKNFITESLAQTLHLPREYSSTVVVGIGGKETESRGKTKLRFNSRVQPDVEFAIEAEILPVVTLNLTERPSEVPAGLQDLQLADRLFWKGGRVDAVLGAGVYGKILLGGMRSDKLLAQESHFGWILSGIMEGASDQIIRCYSALTERVDEKLLQFWETEEKIVPVPAWTQEQIDAEEFYEATTERNENGRYICRLPIRNDFALGSSRGSAVAQMMKLEKQFEKDISFKDRYLASVHEYIDLGHAVPVTSEIPTRHCFLPHLAIIKDESLTTKTRVVFNASNPTSNKRSLNDNLLIGPVVQRDLVAKILRFRSHPFVFSCDIEKMYRQILMHPEDQPLQLFVWRDSQDDPLQYFQLTTVTFGQASAPFTATRTLVKLARDSLDQFPLASRILINDTYVDDLHFGTETVEELLAGCRELNTALATAGFSARKYVSNVPVLTKYLPVEITSKNEEIKFLGIIWNSRTDTLRYSAPQFRDLEMLTKKELLSDISGIFDPMGWVQPIVILAKILMQSLWILKLQWTEQMPADLMEQWRAVANSLAKISQLTIPRWTNLLVGETADLHGFCDASQKAYGAVIYLRTKSGVQQLIAKSRVAPLTNTTIPRLELKGAVLLADLFDRVRSSMGDLKLSCTGWSDSRVVLHWIKGAPSKWQPFVRNRTHLIRESISPENWEYVKSADNPADLVSRGCTFEEMTGTSMWQNGPDWLPTWIKLDQERPAATEEEEEAIRQETLKIKVMCTVVCQREKKELDDLLERWSSWYKVCRIVGYMRRFLANSRRPHQRNGHDHLTTEELKSAEICVVIHMQYNFFEHEIRRLNAGKLVSKTSKLRSLSPFIDSEGLLRVGGRLQRSLLPFDEKHPMILNYQPVLDSLIKRHHIAVCHGGPALTLGNLRRRFWIVNGTQVVKKWIRSCLVCHRSRPKLMQQLMASLPPARISLTKSFMHSGVDFAGPITLKAEVGRGSRNYKGYIAVFICLATKAIHLEVVSSLSADSFMAALRRFVGRRGPVGHMYSDNGTNLVGVFRQLDGIQQMMEKETMLWSFIPPAAPHFGGLWEAGVKSMKTHLKKILGSTTCTFEELSTVTVQIEAVLNSRPLCPLTGDMDDLDALTPNHFLTGHQYVPIPDDTENEERQLVTRYDHLQGLFHTVCRRYKEEYITRLQQRPKWLGTSPPVRVGALVLIQEENVATTKWQLGRIVETHAGSDGLVRVVTLLTKDGVRKRPITRISPLPISDARAVLSDEEIAKLRVI